MQIRINKRHHLVARDREMEGEYKNEREEGRKMIKQDVVVHLLIEYIHIYIFRIKNLQISIDVTPFRRIFLLLFSLVCLCYNFRINVCACVDVDTIYISVCIYNLCAIIDSRYVCVIVVSLYFHVSYMFSGLFTQQKYAKQNE